MASMTKKHEFSPVLLISSSQVLLKSTFFPKVNSFSLRTLLLIIETMQLPMGIIITNLESTSEIDVCTLQARNNN